MNIFYLDESSALAAQYHCDKHVVKMILESAQLLSTAHRVLDGKKVFEEHRGKFKERYRMPGPLETSLYEAAYVKHPCSLWARESFENYMWLYWLFIRLLDEYTYRYYRET